MKGRMSKAGFFMLALVLAVGTMGAAYASWTDEVVIEGEVTTGSLGYEICEFSETWVYKELATGLVVRLDAPLSEEEAAAQGLLLVASADWLDQVPGPLQPCLQGHNQSFTVEFDNLFPCVWFKADIVLHYIGSIPAKLSPEMLWSEDPDSAWLKALWDMDPAEFYMLAYKWTEVQTGQWAWVVVPLEGLQLEFCDRVMIEWWIHIPQEDALMNKTGGFTTTINMIQWNEYPAPPGPPGP